MTAYVALLRAVNVGGTGKLPMAELVGMCQRAGFRDVRTYIASGNAVFSSPLDEAGVRDTLAQCLHAYAGKPVVVLVRIAAEMAAVVTRNPFKSAAGNRVVALFVDEALPNDPLQGVTGIGEEQLALGERELFIHYGMAWSVRACASPSRHKVLVATSTPWPDLRRWLRSWTEPPVQPCLRNQRATINRRPCQSQCSAAAGRPARQIPRR